MLIRIYCPAMYRSDVQVAPGREHDKKWEQYHNDKLKDMLVMRAK